MRPSGQDHGAFRLTRIQAAAAVGLFVVSSLFHVLIYAPANDHFERISRARQIAQYGELPFRDFLDPGYFLTLFSSAILQRVLGDNLLGEALLNTLCFSLGFVLVLLLTLRLTRSVIAAVLATLFAIALAPRTYDYDKVLFPVLGIFLLWRYLDRPSARNLVIAAVGTLIALLFRYDTGVYIGCALAAGLIVAHWGQWTLMTRRLGIYIGATALAGLPALIFIQMTAGVGVALDQVISYAQTQALPSALDAPEFDLYQAPTVPGSPVNVRWVDLVSEAERAEAEEAYGLAQPVLDSGRTWAYRLQDRSEDNVRNLVEDPRIEDTSGIDRGSYEVLTWEPLWSRLSRAFPWMISLSPDNSIAFIYCVCLFIPWLALLLLGLARIRGRMDQVETGQIMSLAVLCLLLGAFILRPPIEARVGGAAPPIAVLGAWIAASFVRRPTGAPALTTEGGTGVSPTHRLSAGHMVRLAVVTIVLVTIGYSAMTFTAWDRKLRSAQISLNPVSFVATVGPKLLQKRDDLAQWRAPGPLMGLTEYVRRCTRPVDKVLTVGGFMPELPFFARRGFAGGMLVSLHWPAPRFEERVLSWLRQDPPQIVVVSVPRHAVFEAAYPIVENYLVTNYRSAGESSFAGRPQDVPLRILVPRNAVPIFTDDRFPVPCFR